MLFSPLTWYQLLPQVGPNRGCKAPPSKHTLSVAHQPHAAIFKHDPQSFAASHSSASLNLFFARLNAPTILRKVAHSLPLQGLPRSSCSSSKPLTIFSRFASFRRDKKSKSSSNSKRSKY